MVSSSFLAYCQEDKTPLDYASDPQLVLEVKRVFEVSTMLPDAEPAEQRDARVRVPSICL